jgi:hypothetical protein
VILLIRDGNYLFFLKNSRSTANSYKEKEHAKSYKL